MVISYDLKQIPIIIYIYIYIFSLVFLVFLLVIPYYTFFQLDPDGEEKGRGRRI